MALKSIKDTVELPCSAQRAYEAWLDSKEHGLMTGGSDSDAVIEPAVGGSFNIWDGAATGTTTALDPDTFTITQTWRYDYDDWPKDQPSTLTIRFEPYKQGCRVVFKQTDLPEVYAQDVAMGWKTYYWQPMRTYFSTAR